MASACAAQVRRPSESDLPEEDPKPPKKEFIVGRSVKTSILLHINGGSFGEIYLGKLVSTGEEVAVKLEKQNVRAPQLLFEGNVYRHLEGGPGIPQTYWFGLHEPEYNVLVMELLGPSLQDLFSYCNRKFSLKTVLMLIDQMLDIVQFVHNNHFIHRDIKPDNFMIGRGKKCHQVYIIDFGLAKKYNSHRVFGHHHYKIAHGLVGTARYASLHAHLGHEESRRDDMEALGYVWLYFLQGSLPWQGLEACSRVEKYTKIKDMKLDTNLSVLCKDLPQQFGLYLDYTRHLKMDAVPDYAEVKDMFRKLAEVHGLKYDNAFDWIAQQENTGEDYTVCNKFTSEIHDSS